MIYKSEQFVQAQSVHCDFPYDCPSTAPTNPPRVQQIMTSASESSSLSVAGNGDATIEARRLPFFRMLLLCGLSLSIGWGVRGNFGHQYGAMIPGALAAMAAVLLSGREDWWRRIAYFAMFGALGWSFGGSISYMWVIGYTHSGHFPSQVYGFACLALIGFLWGALGGAGTALPAFLDRERLTEFFPPIIGVLAAWTLKDLVTDVRLVHAFRRAMLLIGVDLPGWVTPFIANIEGANRHESFLYWYDTNWIAALVAIVAVLVLAAVRRRWCWGTSFILHMAVGWWLGFLLVVLMVDRLGIEFRMTPPRGDNWAGILGMTAGALVYLLRNGMRPVVHAMLVSGFFGAFGFATATFLKLVEVKYAARGPELFVRGIRLADELAQHPGTDLRLLQRRGRRRRHGLPGASAAADLRCARHASLDGGGSCLVRPARNHLRQRHQGRLDVGKLETLGNPHSPLRDPQRSLVQVRLRDLGSSGCYPADSPREVADRSGPSWLAWQRSAFVCGIPMVDCHR